MSVNFTPASIAAGEIPTAAKLNSLMHDPWTGLQDTWTPYTPTWAAATTNPVIGNGTIVAAYMRIGHTVIWTVAITMGSTTTYGSGGWTITLPLAAASRWPVNSAMGSGITNMLAAATQPVIARLNSDSATVSLIVPGAAVDATHPGNWSSGQSLTLTGTYECA